MCPFCDRKNALKEKSDPSFIYEFEHCYLVLGEHQYYQGYSVLILKEHIADLTDLSLKVQTSFLADGMKAAKVIKDIFKPYKMNYAVLGNEVEHVHLHLIPRYTEELTSAEIKHPWHHASEFKNFIPSVDERDLIIEKIQNGFRQ